jgi:hypothetical protein
MKGERLQRARDRGADMGILKGFTSKGKAYRALISKLN